jgi:hypothetical protein
MEALTSRRSQGTRVGHTNPFRRRITRLDRFRSSASTQRHLTSATEHERALTIRELALRAVANVGADRQLPYPQRQRHHARVPTQESPSYRAAGAWRVVVTTSRHPRTRARHRRGDEPCARLAIARPHGVRLGVTMRVHRVRIVRAYRPLRSQDEAASLELIQQQQVIVAGQRGVIMRGRRGSRYWPRARRRARTSDVARRARHRPHVDGHVDETMLALARLLARQAARDVFAQTAMESDHPIEESRE